MKNKILKLWQRKLYLDFRSITFRTSDNGPDNPCSPCNMPSPMRSKILIYQPIRFGNRFPLCQLPITKSEWFKFCVWLFRKITRFSRHIRERSEVEAMKFRILLTLNSNLSKIRNCVGWLNLNSDLMITMINFSNINGVFAASFFTNRSVQS